MASIEIELLVLLIFAELLCLLALICDPRLAICRYTSGPSKMSVVSNGGVESAPSCSELVILISKFVQDWEISDLDAFSSDEYAVVWLAFEVPLAFDTSVVLSSWFVEFDTYPGADTTHNLGNVANVNYSASSVISLWQQTTACVLRNAAFLDFAVSGVDFLLLNTGCIGVESTQLVGFLPRQHTVCAVLVLLLGQFELLD